MKGYKAYLRKFCIKLYIPHGSDERIKLRIKMKMKKPLYPTWFRWKEEVNRRRWFNPHALYPTWFRWKTMRLYELDNHSLLYIPHGSDERGKDNVFSLIKMHFISHMVQMKAGILHAHKSVLENFISHMVQMKVIGEFKLCFDVLSLYPTWFRWKIVTLTYPADFASDFISHMVQMKAIYASSNQKDW